MNISNNEHFLLNVAEPWQSGAHLSPSLLLSDAQQRESHVRLTLLLSTRHWSNTNRASRAQVLAAIADGVQREMGELLSAVMAPASGLHAFEFLGGSLMPEVDEAISKALPGWCFWCF